MLVLGWKEDNYFTITAPNGDKIKVIHNGRKGGLDKVGIEADSKYQILRDKAGKTDERKP